MQTRLLLATALWIFALSANLASGSPPQLDNPLVFPLTPPEPTQDFAAFAAPAANSGLAVDIHQREEVRNFYNALFYASEDVPMGWTGSIAGCARGDTDPAYREASLLRINVLRALAGVPAAVTLDPTYNAKAQQAALMMSANNKLSHTPKQDTLPPNDPPWPCLTDEGDEAAGNSNLSLGYAGPTAITFGQMEDQGDNNTRVGHRRWLLYPQTQQMGVGDVAGDDPTVHPPANAVWIQDAHIGDPRPAVRDDFVAWPPPGYVPYSLVFPRWSFAYPNADFSAAKVTVARAGINLPVTQEAYDPSLGIGESTLVWKPSDPALGDPAPAPLADTRFDVTVENVKIGGNTKPPFKYTVTLFDPAKAGVDTILPTITGPANPAINSAASYSIVGTVPAAGGLEWLRASSLAYATVQDAETDPSEMQPDTIGNELSTDFSVSGAHAYHLMHVSSDLAQASAETRTLTLNKLLVPGPTGKLKLQSRLGLATSSEVARVQYSLDDGHSWRDIFTQYGQDTGLPIENGFTPLDLPLSGLVGRPVRFRFRFDVPNQSSYSLYPAKTSDPVPVPVPNLGWYLDDVAFEDVAVLESPAIAAAANGNFTFTPTSSSARMLAARGTVQGKPLEWGPVKPLFGTILAEAGLNRIVPLGSSISLDGSASYGPKTLGYAWTQNPSDTNQTPLANANTAHPTFTPPAIGVYNFNLTVSDTTPATANDTVTITVQAALTANAGEYPAPFGTGNPVTLQGSGTGNPLTFAWHQIDGPAPATLDNPALANPTFTPSAPGTYRFGLTVGNGPLHSAEDIATVTVTSTDKAPVANAGPDKPNVVIGSPVTLDGSKSTDQDTPLANLKYSWQAIQWFGATPVLAGIDQQPAQRTFTPAIPGTYIFELVVSDGIKSTADTVSITVTNQAPVANAGPPQTVVIGKQVTLDGSGSADSDHAPFPLAYTWFPRIQGVVLSGADPAHPSFTPTLTGTYPFDLYVSDGNRTSNVATVNITVTNQAPVANAGTDRQIVLGSPVTLDGRRSNDPDHAPAAALAYAWQQTRGPIAVALSGANTAQPSFMPQIPGVYVFGLMVGDGNLASAVAMVSITVTNQAPVANAGPDQQVEVGTPVTLDGGASVDPDNAPLPLAYKWLAPEGVPLTATDTTHPSFTPDSPGTYTFGLIVHDGNIQTAMDSVTITVVDTLPLRLLNPKGGEILKVKQKQTVTWKSTGLPATAKLTLSFSKSGGKWTQIATFKNTGRYVWKIGKAQAGGAVSLRLCGPKSLGALRCNQTRNPFEVQK